MVHETKERRWRRKRALTKRVNQRMLRGPSCATQNAERLMRIDEAVTLLRLFIVILTLDVPTWSNERHTILRHDSWFRCLFIVSSLFLLLTLVLLNCLFYSKELGLHSFNIHILKCHFIESLDLIPKSISLLCTSHFISQHFSLYRCLYRKYP